MHSILTRTPAAKRPFDLSRDGKIISNKSYRITIGGCELDSSDSGQGPMLGFLQTQYNLWLP